MQVTSVPPIRMWESSSSIVDGLGYQTQFEAYIEQRLHPNGGVDFTALELGQVRVQDAESLLRVIVAIEPEPCIAGVVVSAVKPFELVVGQLGDDRGVAAAVDGIGVVGEEGVDGGAVIGLVWRRVHALHLIEDDTLEGHVFLKMHSRKLRNDSLHPRKLQCFLSFENRCKCLYIHKNIPAANLSRPKTCSQQSPPQVFKQMHTFGSSSS